MATKKGLTGKQKAALLLISLGPDVSAEIYKHLTEDEIEKLTLEISTIKNVSSDKKDEIMEEFYNLVMAQDYISQGGIGYAKMILEKALGPEQANLIINRLTSSLQVKPFDFARKADPNQILNFIQNEHPQTIALILSYLESNQAAQILSNLPEEMQADVARRIALMDSTSPDVIYKVEQILEQKLSATVTTDYTQTGGIEAVVDVLNGVDRATERTILEELAYKDPELAEEIKKRMFVFEDIVTLDNRAIQLVIRDCDNEDLILALKVASEEVKEVIFKNMSTRMRETFQEELEVMGPVRLRDVEEAQGRIVGVIRRLEESGEIIIARGGGDDIFCSPEVVSQFKKNNIAGIDFGVVNQKDGTARDDVYQMIFTEKLCREALYFPRGFVHPCCRICGEELTHLNMPTTLWYMMGVIEEKVPKNIDAFMTEDKFREYGQQVFIVSQKVRSVIKNMNERNIDFIPLKTI